MNDLINKKLNEINLKVLMLITLIIVTMFSIIVYPGYEVFIGDHIFYFPPILKTLNPSLYNGDILRSFEITSYTFFDELIVYLIHYLNINLFNVLFGLSLIVRFIYFYSIFKISMFISKDKYFSIILVFFFCLVQIKLGSLNNYLVPRSFGIALGLLSLTLYFGQKRTLSALVVGASLWFHIPSFIPFVAFFYLALIIDYNKDLIKKSALTLGFIPILFLLVILFFSDTSSLGIFNQYNENYYNFTMMRAPDFFLLSGPGLRIISIYLKNYLLIGIALYTIADSLDKIYFRYIIIITLVTFILLIITIIGSDFIGSVFIVQLQIQRAYQILQIISVILFIYCTYIQLKYQNPYDIISLLLIGSISSLLIFGHKHDIVLLFLFFIVALLFIRHRYGELLQTLNNSIIISLVTITSFFILYLIINGNTVLGIKVSMILSSIILIPFLIKLFEFPVFFRTSFLIMFFGFSIVLALNVKNYSVQPKYYNDMQLMETCNWIRGNTKVDDVFLTQPFTTMEREIRLTSARSIFPTYKTLGSALYDEKYAFRLMERYNYIDQYLIKVSEHISFSGTTFFHGGYESSIKLFREPTKDKQKNIKEFLLTSPETESLIKGIKQKYRLDYVISETELFLSYPIVYSNDKYIIYRL